MPKHSKEAETHHYGLIPPNSIHFSKQLHTAFASDLRKVDNLARQEDQALDAGFDHQATNKRRMLENELKKTVQKRLKPDTVTSSVDTKNSSSSSRMDSLYGTTLSSCLTKTEQTTLIPSASSIIKNYLSIAKAADIPLTPQTAVERPAKISTRSSSTLCTDKQEIHHNGSNVQSLTSNVTRIAASTEPPLCIVIDDSDEDDEKKTKNNVDHDDEGILDKDELFMSDFTKRKKRRRRKCVARNPVSRVQYRTVTTLLEPFYKHSDEQEEMNFFSERQPPASRNTDTSINNKMPVNGFDGFSDTEDR